ncbi:DNA-binding transcriptional LysR family regulator [Aliiruegeria haliotis]|uniref:DNA-binding transcriptional LysR family regulator n=1 Tax=Aliiruegeria haliotis TaxID=1280846 RepID=A0A2T0RI28_9RHOB|nr:LysR family transcriptional regulator [Aliiruegeria haliotis]PRY20866.1 DNA-binding transcriptional LysR family regulator [Aliiruegeria haliotis]
MLDNLDFLRRFAAVAEHGTIHRAAEVVGISQPALTRSIKLLEEQVGAALFERRSRGVHLTPLGERVLAQARHLIRESQLAETEILSYREGEQGTFRISAAPVWMTAILPQVVAQLHRQFPSLAIQLEAANYSEALPKLANAECDAFFGGFQRIEALQSFLVRRPLFHSHLQILVRKGHPIFFHDGITPDHLLEYQWVSFQSDGAYLDAARQAVQARTGKSITAAVQCDSMLTALELLRQGDYLALLPSSFLFSTYGDGLTAVHSGLDTIVFESGPIFRRSLLSNSAFTRLLELAENRAKVLGLLS